ncbi:hypothetical protein HYPSUDRAFT_69870 [Hypholoma sublateritium FD-334 SS-4]|uniref:DUF6699 domain-containing protein n=1 Tax=Hypholoma sublateritium (strain FD-334 SS-4) TaxID=945553 RepID=A0A0D2NHN8_HYPSF|nr:hypothetical protein HYPSUDRAFT_69870 [Hypholoma sublateritium FD-334 SS-4]
MPLFKDRPQHYNGESEIAPRSLFNKLRHWLYFRRGAEPATFWNPEDFSLGRGISRPPRGARTVTFPPHPHIPAAVPNGRGNHKNRTRFSPPDNQQLYQFTAPSQEPDNLYPYQYTTPASALPPIYSSHRGQSRTVPRIPGYTQQAAYPVLRSNLTDTHHSRHRNNTENRIQQNMLLNTGRPPHLSAQSPQPERGRGERRTLTQRPAPRTPSNPRSDPPPAHDLRGTDYALLTELIPAVSRYPSVDWIICFPLSTAFKWVGPEAKEALNLDALAIIPPIKGVDGVSISTRKDNDGLSLVLERFGPITLASDEYLTVGSILGAIKAYFSTPLSTTEMDALDPIVRKHVTKSYRRRWDAQGQVIKKQVWPMLSCEGPTRVDFLFNYFRYAGLEMDKNFAANGKLYLTLHNSWLTRR